MDEIIAAIRAQREREETEKIRKTERESARLNRFVDQLPRLWLAIEAGHEEDISAPDCSRAQERRATRNRDLGEMVD